MTFAKLMCHLALCLTLTIGTHLAAQSAQVESYQAGATATDPADEVKPAKFRTSDDRSPYAAAGTSFVRVDTACLHGGHQMQLSWKMQPDHDDVRVAIIVQIPGDVPLRLDAGGARGKRSLALTPAGTGLATLNVSFIDDRSRTSARANLALPYPDTSHSSVEATAEQSRLHGALKVEITKCPPSGRPIGAVRTEEEAERDANASEEDERRELISAESEFQLLVFGTSGVTSPFWGGQSSYTSNEPPFDREKMATCIEREMYDRNAMGYGYAMVQNKQIFGNSIGAGGWARSPFEDHADSISTNPNTPMMVASVSKVITAMAIMKLVQDGELGLGDAFYPLVQSEYPSAGSSVQSNHDPRASSAQKRIEAELLWQNC